MLKELEEIIHNNHLAHSGLECVHDWEQKNKPIFFPPSESDKLSIIVVSEAPNKSAFRCFQEKPEDSMIYAFSPWNPIAAFLRIILRDSFRRNSDRVYWTHAQKYPKVKSQSKQNKQCHICSGSIQEEIEVIQPESIITLGDFALRAVLGPGLWEYAKEIMNSKIMERASGIQSIKGSSLPYNLFPLRHPNWGGFGREVLSSLSDHQRAIEILKQKFSL